MRGYNRSTIWRGGGITRTGGGDGISGPGGGGYTCPPPPEHHHPIHHDSSDIRAVSGFGAAANIRGSKDMERTVGSRLGGRYGDVEGIIVMEVEVEVEERRGGMEEGNKMRELRGRVNVATKYHMEGA